MITSELLTACRGSWLRLSGQYPARKCARKAVFPWVAQININLLRGEQLLDLHRDGIGRFENLKSFKGRVPPVLGKGVLQITD